MILLRPTLGLFSIIYIQLFLPLECTPALDSDSETSNPQTSLETTIVWGNVYPTFSPSGSLSYRHPYLFYTTVTFGIIILGTTILVITKACSKNCGNNHRYCTHECTRPILSRYRLSLVPTDAILINNPELDKPPDYASAVSINVEEPKSPRTMNEKTYFYSETPPPSYGSIENTTTQSLK